MHTILNLKLVVSFPVLAGALWQKKFPALAPIGGWVISRDWDLYLIFPRFLSIMWLVLPFNIAKISTQKLFRIDFNAGCNKINLCKSRRSICFKILTVSRYHRALSVFSLLKFVKSLNINCVQSPWFYTVFARKRKSVFGHLDKHRIRPLTRIIDLHGITYQR